MLRSIWIADNLGKLWTYFASHSVKWIMICALHPHFVAVVYWNALSHVSLPLYFSFNLDSPYVRDLKLTYYNRAGMDTRMNIGTSLRSRCHTVERRLLCRHLINRSHIGLRA